VFSSIWVLRIILCVFVSYEFGGLFCLFLSIWVLRIVLCVFFSMGSEDCLVCFFFSMGSEDCLVCFRLYGF
jgi:hypothetical protein